MPHFPGTPAGTLEKARACFWKQARASPERDAGNPSLATRQGPDRRRQPPCRNGRTRASPERNRPATVSKLQDYDSRQNGVRSNQVVKKRHTGAREYLAQGRVNDDHRRARLSAMPRQVTQLRKAQATTSLAEHNGDAGNHATPAAAPPPYGRGHWPILVTYNNTSSQGGRIHRSIIAAITGCAVAKAVVPTDQATATTTAPAQAATVLTTALKTTPARTLARSGSAPATPSAARTPRPEPGQGGQTGKEASRTATPDRLTLPPHQGNTARPSVSRAPGTSPAIDGTTSDAATQNQDNSAPSAIWSSLSEAERECLPAGITDRSSLTAALGDSSNDQAINCLDDDSRLILCTEATADEAGRLSESTSRCISDATDHLARQPADNGDDAEVHDPTEALAEFFELVLGATVLVAYCMTGEELGKLGPGTRKQRPGEHTLPGRQRRRSGRVHGRGHRKRRGQPLRSGKSLHCRDGRSRQLKTGNLSNADISAAKHPAGTTGRLAP